MNFKENLYKYLMFGIILSYIVAVGYIFTNCKGF
jgi:hypothetical protein